MANFADYLDSDYLPGQVYSAGLSEYKQQPMDITSYLAEKKFKFQPSKDDGSFFDKFLALQANPQAVLMKNINLPEGFQKMVKMFGGQ
jgi:hypothetical protein